MTIGEGAAGRIASCRPAEADGWQRLADLDPAATFFQTPAWVKLVLAMGTGWRDAALHVRFEDGREAVVPRMRMRLLRGLLATHESVPPGVYGAPVASPPLPAEDVRALAGLYAGRILTSAVVTESPSARLDLGVERSEKPTQILEASDEPERGYRKGHRAAIARALREGIRPVLAEREEEFLAYHEAYLQTARRWERRPWLVYPRELFAAAWRASVEDRRRVRLWLAVKDGRVLGGALVLRQGVHAGYWHGATSDEGRPLLAGHLAVHAAIEDAFRTGAARFDFLPSGGLDDVAHFKSGFGAQVAMVGIHAFPPSALYRAVRRLRALVPLAADGTARRHLAGRRDTVRR